MVDKVNVQNKRGIQTQMQDRVTCAKEGEFRQMGNEGDVGT